MSSVSEQTRFWFVDARLQDGTHIGLAVAAFTERSARVQARKNIGREATIVGVTAVLYAHAWRIDFSLRS